MQIQKEKRRPRLGRIRWRELHETRLSTEVQQQQASIHPSSTSSSSSSSRSNTPLTPAQETLQSQLEDLGAFIKSVITMLPPA